MTYTTMIFASLELERDPPTWAEFPAMVSGWVQIAGGAAAIALFFWWLHYFAEKHHKKRTTTSLFDIVFVAFTGISWLCYVSFFASVYFQGTIPVDKSAKQSSPGVTSIYTAGQLTYLTVAGFFALLAVIVPMVAGLASRISFRRIGALARLSVKEAVRGRVLYVFSLMAIIFLFAGYFVSFKDEDQIRNYVSVIYWAMTPLFLVTAAFLGSFSIPNDVQKQTIHTIVTKPVEKYEIVLGRFLGYGFLLTIVMAVLTGISLLYVVRGVNEQARQESYKARVPVFAESLSFFGTASSEKGVSVGREWTYKSYIRGRTPGTQETQQYAIWAIDELPLHLKDNANWSQFEFAFDIFRTTKGREDQGVFCTMTFASTRDPSTGRPAAHPLIIEGRVAQMNAELSAEKDKIAKKLGITNFESSKIEGEMRDLKNRLADKYGIYQDSGIMVTDYHTQSVSVPPGLIKRVIATQESAKNISAGEESSPPALLVMVNVNNDVASAQQYIGVAKRDLYLLAYELPFWQNFVKMIVGLWCNVMILLGVAVACSTYMSGIISLLCTMFLLLAGTVSEYIRNLVAGTNVGGGPFESANRLFSRLPLAAPLEKTAATQIGTGLDEAYRWVLGYVLYLLPDVQRYDLTTYVAEGFNISWTQNILLDNVLPMIGYLIPWAILAYYLMKSREIANPM